LQILLSPYQNITSVRLVKNKETGEALATEKQGSTEFLCIVLAHSFN